ncbi:exo1 [Symbiodinium sp. CCMP2592]|nr:exo1 [Symbiodinium sp. CCMP2592]
MAVPPAASDLKAALKLRTAHRSKVQLRGSSSVCKLKAESLVEPQVREDCEVITADALPVKTGRGFMYLCSKNTMVPSGLLPLVVLATYCKQEAQQSSASEFKLKVRFHGSWEEFSLQAHDLRVFSVIEEVRNNMDKEFGPHISLTRRKQITVERAASVRRLMDQLHGGEPPVRSMVRPSEDFVTSLLPSLSSLGLQF